MVLTIGTDIKVLDMETDQITGEPLDHCALLVSDGKVKLVQLPPFTELRVKSSNGKITLVENIEKHKF